MSYYQAQYVLSKCFRNKTNRLSANNLYSVQDYFNAVYDEENDALRICFDGQVPGGGPTEKVEIFVEGYAEIEDGYVVAFYSDEEMQNIITPISEKFYIDINTDTLYRWNGVDYIGISSIELGEEEGTAYPGNKGKELEEQIKQLENSFNNQYIIVYNSSNINLLNRQTAICVVENCSLTLPKGELGSVVKIYIAKGSNVKIMSKDNFILEENNKEFVFNQELTYLLLLFDVNKGIWYLTYSDTESHLVL